MFINFWYPVALATDVSADKPTRAQVFGLPFVVFRDLDGQARVLADTCVHRGGSLSKGRQGRQCRVSLSRLGVWRRRQVQQGAITR